MRDTASIGDKRPQWTEIRAAIGAILANKYKGAPSTSPRFLSDQANAAVTSDDVDAKTFESKNKIAMNILAGAAARQDKTVVEVVPLLHKFIASPSPNSEIAAQSLGIIVQDNEFLTSENHAVVKRFYRQWAYNHVAKPLYELALPSKSDASTVAKYSTAILSIVSKCPYTVYEDDLEPLVRFLITALGKQDDLVNKEISRRRTVSALEVLVEILSNEPDSLTGHLKPIVTGGTSLYKEVCGEGGSGRQLVMARKLVLQLLGAIPTKFEERHLLSYAPQMKRMLAMACGDSVREIRRTAIVARENWNKIAG